MNELLTGGGALLLAGSRDPNAKVTAVIMGQSGGAPEQVIKIATTEQAALVVQAEGRLLAELAGRLPLEVTRTVPQVLGYGSVDDLPALITRGVPGTPMLADYHLWRHVARRRKVTADFTAAAAWLAALQSTPTGPPAPVFADVSVPDRLAPVLAPLTALTLPRTISHGDYWLGNILLTKGRVTGVVDWEAGEIVGEPLRDVARFVLSYALYLHRHTAGGRRVAGHAGLRATGFGPGILYVLQGGGWFPTLAREFVSDALQRLGAPRTLWRAVLIAGVADVIATADDPRFAQEHLDLLGQVRP